MILWRAFCRPALPAIAANDTEAAIPRTSTNAHITRGLDEFAPLFERSLGAPLYDPPPAKKMPQEKEPKVVRKNNSPKKENRRAAVGLRVIGTMIEARRSLAILVDADGRIQLRGEGDSIETPVGEGQVDKIELKQVTISLEHDTLTLKAP